MRAAFVVTGLMTGGAEMMLYKLLKALPPTRWEPLVISLSRGGEPAALIRQLGVEVRELGLHASVSWRLPGALSQGRSTLRDFQPALVCGWMYHGNLAAWLFSRGLGVPLIWSIRQTLNMPREKPLTRAVIRAGAALSKAPRRIVYASQIAREQHQALGYDDEHACVIANGFELDVFRRDPAERARLRQQFGVTENTCVVGHLARFHPMKDQQGLIEAARRVIVAEPDVLFVLAGRGLDASNRGLVRAIGEGGLGQHVRLLGEANDPQGLLSACDLFCLPSAWGEGFPNAVGEAMACELPCVITRVGAGPDLVGPSGLVVEPLDRAALAEALIRLIRVGAGERARLGARARRRIEENYSLTAIAAHYAELFHETALQAGVQVA